MEKDGLFKEVERCHLRFVAQSLVPDKSGEHKVRIKARDAAPIYHWYWGRIVHDFAGMQWHRDRVAIDWCHRDSELLGYVDSHDVQPDGLYLSGVLTPFRDGDRANEVIHLLDAGVPLEASIDFSDEVELAFLPSHAKATVNGIEIDGGEDGCVIVTKWFLRRIAICPSGADSATETEKEWTEKPRTIEPRIYQADNNGDQTMPPKANPDTPAPEPCQQCAEKDAQLAALTEQVAQLTEQATKTTSEHEAKIAELTAAHATKVAEFEAEKTSLNTKLTAALNGTSTPVSGDDKGGAEPQTWKEAVEKFGYVKAREKYVHLRK